MDAYRPSNTENQNPNHDQHHRHDPNQQQNSPNQSDLIGEFAWGRMRAEIVAARRELESTFPCILELHAWLRVHLPIIGSINARWKLGLCDLVGDPIAKSLRNVC